MKEIERIISNYFDELRKHNLPLPEKGTELAKAIEQYVEDNYIPKDSYVDKQHLNMLNEAVNGNTKLERIITEIVCNKEAGKKIAKAIEQYVIKARIEELEWANCNSYLRAKKTTERIAELKSKIIT